MKNRISEFLRKRNMTQRDLSEKTGLVEASISRYVSGERDPRVANAIKIANVLQCTVDELFNEKYTDNPNQEEIEDSSIEIVLKFNKSEFKRNDIVCISYSHKTEQSIFDNENITLHRIGRITTITDYMITVDIAKRYESDIVNVKLCDIIDIMHVRKDNE